MFTLLSIQTVNPGREAEYVAIQQKVWTYTHGKEPGLVRYEHYRGPRERQFYSLLVFRDFDAFLEHQVADYHDEVDWMGMFAEHELQVLDPLAGANALDQTRIPPHDSHADPLRRHYAEMVPGQRPAWWGTPLSPTE